MRKPTKFRFGTSAGCHGMQGLQTELVRAPTFRSKPAGRARPVDRYPAKAVEIVTDTMQAFAVFVTSTATLIVTSRSALNSNGSSGSQFALE